MAHEVLYGKFDFNRTPLAPPGAKALIFEAASRRAARGPRPVDKWYIGPAINRYRALKFYIESTRGIRISSNYRLTPTHCRVPSISEEDETVLAAAKELNYFNSEFDGDKQIKHKQIIQQLTQIVANGPTQRVAARPPQRVIAPSTRPTRNIPRQHFRNNTHDSVGNQMIAMRSYTISEAPRCQLLEVEYEH